MKNILYILLALIVALLAWFYLTKQSPQNHLNSQSTNAVAESQPLQLETNLAVEVPSNTHPVSVVMQQQATSEPINALTTTNLEQWKTMISGLKHSADFITWDSWVKEQTNRMTGIPVLLQANGQAISYKVHFIDVDVYKGSEEKIMEVQMHSPVMNIDETRELGLQLCTLLQIDPKGFLAWCDQVGNRWMDQPLFGDGDGHHYSFHLLQTFDNEKPWSINFMIIPNP
jgi:hypothetical protein